MKPLGHFENYNELQVSLEAECSKGSSFGFLLDCPRTFKLKNSGLISAPESVLNLDKLLGDHLKIYYATPSSREYRSFASEFNSNLLQSLQIKFEAKFPCLILCRAGQGQIRIEKYIALGNNPCMYYWDVFHVISSYIELKPIAPDFAEQGNWLTGTMEKLKIEIPISVFMYGFAAAISQLSK